MKEINERDEQYFKEKSKAGGTVYIYNREQREEKNWKD